MATDKTDPKWTRKLTKRKEKQVRYNLKTEIDLLSLRQENQEEQQWARSLHLYMQLLP